jgi:hypothetical protein
MEFDIIYDEYEARWFNEHTINISRQLKSWCEIFADEESRKPSECELVVGLKVWEYLTSLIDNYSQYYVLGLEPKPCIKIYDLEIPLPEPDWSVNTKYIKLTLK